MAYEYDFLKTKLNCQHYHTHNPWWRMTQPAGGGVAQSEQNARDAHQFGALCLRRCVFNALRQRCKWAREREQVWGWKTMMMTALLLRSIHAGFVTVAAHDPEPEPALARPGLAWLDCIVPHMLCTSISFSLSLPLAFSRSHPLSVLICVSRFCILIALSYSHRRQPPPPLDGATCATWPPACNSSDNFSSANPLCCTCLRLSYRLCARVRVRVCVLSSHSNWLVHNPEIPGIKPAPTHTQTNTGSHTSAQLNTIWCPFVRPLEIYL